MCVCVFVPGGKGSLAITHLIEINLNARKPSYGQLPYFTPYGHTVPLSSLARIELPVCRVDYRVHILFLFFYILDSLTTLEAVFLQRRLVGAILSVSIQCFQWHLLHKCS